LHLPQLNQGEYQRKRYGHRNLQVHEEEVKALSLWQQVHSLAANGSVTVIEICLLGSGGGGF